MAIDLSRGFAERLERRTDVGGLFDGHIRYVTMRADVLMGAFTRLPAELRAPALAALAASVAEHGGRSIAAYRAAGAVDPTVLAATIVATSADLGWGRWTFLRRDDGTFDVTVAGSPFAEAARGALDRACAPIVGLLTALAPLLVAEGASVREIACAAADPDGSTPHLCRFEIRR